MPAVKSLGQAAPSATTETDLYTCGVANGAVSSSIVVCNRGSSPATFRISHAVGGGATANKDYLHYDLSIDGNDTYIATIGICIANNDKIKVYASTANLSFNLYGQENT